MADNLTRKIIRTHLAQPSEMKVGDPISLKIDQTLTHDINAVMCYLAFEGIGIPRVQVDKAVSYLDHNLLYVNSNTPDDHIFLRTLAEHYGIYLSRPGNGIMHTVQMARFGAPGKVSLGTDSHTPSGGAIGMLSIGGGGMDVAVAMAGIPYALTMPEVVRVNLTGHLKPGVSAKDVILEMLRRYTVKGGLGKIYEYVGEGAAALEVPERMTISNMGAELGATCSIFPSDEQVRKFLAAQGRENEYVPMQADEGCTYDGEIEIDLGSLEPLIACPAQPDQVVKVSEVEKIKVDQVFIGSCTNGSYSDIARAATVLKGHHVNENVNCVCGVASKQIYKQLMKDGYIDMLLDAGVRMLEISCGPCTGIGQCCPTNGISVRTSNRNFKGRGGTPDAKLYLASPETAAAIAIRGTFATAEDVMGADVSVLSTIHEPAAFPVDDSMIIPPMPPEEAAKVEIVRGPNIQPLPVPEVPGDHLKAQVSLKAVDNITTDDITPNTAELTAMRSNIPMMSKYCFMRYDPEFAERAKNLGQSIIVGGENYGQGSSREHAAINPMYLGVKAVIAKSLARLHKGNLINHGVIPMQFDDPADYDMISQGDELEIDDLRNQIAADKVTVHDRTTGKDFTCHLSLTQEEKEVVLAGGRLRYVRSKAAERRAQ
jgi:aconitate hydratase